MIAVTKKPRVLILGGTREARKLAEKLDETDLATPVTSLAGVTERRADLPGEVRVGGFGGMAGLMTHLWQEGYTAVVDATHPFARQISRNAAEACEATQVPLLTLSRPRWEPALGERWIEVTDEQAAVETLAEMPLTGGTMVFLALGRMRVDAFGALDKLKFLLRTVDPIEPPFSNCEVVAGKGPFSLDEEVELFERNRVKVLVCRNSGGDGDNKLQAARAVRAPIVMIQRPPQLAQHGVEDVMLALPWISRQIEAR